jgi:hypothetical protein
MSNPTLAEIIKDYRTKAAEYTLLANRLEADYGHKNGASKPVDAGTFDAFAEIEKPSVAKIKAFIEEKSAARAQTLATQFKTTKEIINEIIDANPAVFVKADKGWIKVK